MSNKYNKMKQVTNSDTIEQQVKYQEARIEALQNRLKLKTEQAMRIIKALRNEKKETIQK
jgi:hypothetical protein